METLCRAVRKRLSASIANGLKPVQKLKFKCVFEGVGSMSKLTKSSQLSNRWRASLCVVLKNHNGTKGEEGCKTVASFATQDKRADVLFKSFTELAEMGFKLDSVEQFKGRHMQALVGAWEGRGLSSSTIQNNISIMRTFTHWIGKDGMVLSSASYVAVKGAASRSSVATQDKSWQSNGVAVVDKIAQVALIDARVALQLELQHVFGLRARESWQLRPHLADQGVYLAVNLGTKGGRDRVVPIDTPEKRALIDRAKTFTKRKGDSISDERLSLAQVKNHFYAVCRTAGITRVNGITAHGLRHGYANERYKQQTGHESPVRDGERVCREEDALARFVIAEELGHSREDVTTYYLGRS